MTDGRQADLAIRGLWEPQEFAFIDVSVLDTDAKTFVKQKPMDALVQREEKKVAHYKNTVRLSNGTFSPFIVSADGLLAPQAQKVLNAIAQSLSAKIQGSHSAVLHALRLRLQFALIRATSYVLRAPSRDYHSIGRFPVFVNHELTDNSTLNNLG